MVNGMSATKNRQTHDQGGVALQDIRIDFAITQYVRLAHLNDLGFISDCKVNSRLGLMPVRDYSYHRKMVDLRVKMLRRKHNTLHLQAAPKLTRNLRTPDLKARTHSRLTLNSPSPANVKGRMTVNAQHGSYQSPRKAGEIKKTLIATTSLDTPISNILRGSDTTPGMIEQNMTRYRAPEREDLFVQISLAKNLERILMPFLCWIGHVNRRGNFNEKGSSSTRTHLHSGYAIGFAVTTHWCFALRLELVLSLFVRPKKRGVSLSLGCELKFPRVVTWDSEIVALALRGDLDSMKVTFTAGTASPFDVLPNGSTLLHVCPSPFIQQKTSTDAGIASCHEKST